MFDADELAVGNIFDFLIPNSITVSIVVQNTQFSVIYAKDNISSDQNNIE